MRTIAVDFDGVVHAYSQGWKDGTIYDVLIPGAVTALTALMVDNPVFIFTAREVTSVCEWLEKETPFSTTDEVPEGGFWNERGTLLVTNRKLPAVAYVDDRAIRFRNWAQATAELKLRAGI